ncbi:MAG: hypothetical protein GTO02_16760 [Candidatus Dadabacteria bacterium]|nr:hypothetical protein [Candidatus Dadabacteria bacterium]
MEEKKESFFNSLLFSAIMSIVAIVALAIKVIYQSYNFMIIVWVVIAYYYITDTIKKRKLQ